MHVIRSHVLKKVDVIIGMESGHFFLREKMRTLEKRGRKK
jgi:hypothetical protein